MPARKYEKDSLGDRMKGYENLTKDYLMLGVPHIVRLDMRAGHTFCRGLARPYDAVFSRCMEDTTKFLAHEVSGCAIAYTQSDEISLVLFDSFANGYNCFFDGGVEKIVSTTAAMATLAFNRAFYDAVCTMNDEEYDSDECIFASDETVDADVYSEKLFRATFDSRVFSVPNRSEVVNYLIWRTQDATRNSVNMLAQSVFSHKELQGVNVSDAKDMLTAQGNDWNEKPARYKHGIFFCAADEETESGKLRKTWKQIDADFSGSAWYPEMSELLGESLYRDAEE